MNSDCYFVTGYSHIVCQDYAAAETPEKTPTFAIVSDGCSSSPHTDIGARILTRTALRQLKSYSRECLEGMSPYERDECTFINPLRVAYHSDVLRGELDLPEGATDATLLAAYEAGSEVEVRVWGDGVVAARERGTGKLVVYQIEYPSGAPMYLSYWCDWARRDRYLQKFGSDRKVVIYEPDGFVGEITSRGRKMRFPREKYDVVAVMSDGVHSFKRRVGNGFEPIPMLDVVREMMAFKGLSGEFVVRRMKAFIRQATNEGWRWDDDVSMAAIHTGAVAEGA